jgi:hypothetical protein
LPPSTSPSEAWLSIQCYLSLKHRAVLALARAGATEAAASDSPTIGAGGADILWAEGLLAR